MVIKDRTFRGIFNRKEADAYGALIRVIWQPHRKEEDVSNINFNEQFKELLTLVNREILFKEALIFHICTCLLSNKSATFCILVLQTVYKCASFLVGQEPEVIPARSLISFPNPTRTWVIVSAAWLLR